MASEDAEVAACAVIVAALADLDRPACSRVLKWATARYVDLPGLDFDPEAFKRFTESLVEAARVIGGVTPLDIINAGLAIAAAKTEGDG